MTSIQINNIFQYIKREGITISAEFWSFLGTVIVGILAFAGTYISNHKSNAIWQYRVQQLEEKQDKHNNIIERTYKLERDMASQERDMKTAFNQIGDMKTSIGKMREGMEKLGEEMKNLRETEVRIETQIENYHGN